MQEEQHGTIKTQSTFHTHTHMNKTYMEKQTFGKCPSGFGLLPEFQILDFY